MRWFNRFKKRYSRKREVIVFCQTDRRIMAIHFPYVVGIDWTAIEQASQGAIHGIEVI